jgi:hypothetical protein
MFMEILLTGVIAVILYSLTNTTEQFLAHRAHHAEQTVRLIDHRSRM